MKHNLKRMICICVAALSVGLTACGNQNGGVESVASGTMTDIGTITVDESKRDNKLSVQTSLLQFQAPKAGDTVAVMDTNKGTMKILLFPKQAPKAVENFVTLARQGYYNGVTFHRVIKDFMIQSGDPTATGAGGQSAFGKPFEDEFSTELYNFRGALSMANAGANTNGSQFFVVQASAMDASLLAYNQGLYTKEVEAAYYEVGGTPWLDQKHTVFGQVYEGWDVVNKIAEVKTNKDKPTSDIIIKSVKIYTVQ